MIDLIVGMPLVLPGVIFGAGVLFALSEGPLVLYGTIAAVVIAYAILVLPHVTRILGSGLASMGPTMVDAARTIQTVELSLAESPVPGRQTTPRQTP